MTRTLSLNARHATASAQAPSVVRPEVAVDPGEGVRGTDLTRWGWLRRWLRMPSWQFQLILPNQVLFWVVIVVGLAGSSDPELNFATAITWYVWFCLVFVMILTTGRGWCAVCPFGGLAEWVQRRSLWHRAGARRPLGLGLPFPERLGRYGYLLPVATFALLTWIEEFFEIAGPGAPPLTSALVIGIIVAALVSFLVFERRTFCRYLCPLSTLIGVLGALAPVSGFRARDRAVCAGCTTKDCLRGNDSGRGCPWFNYPGAAPSNLHCGLCGECVRACPSDNVGLFVTHPGSGLLRPGRRRADVAWSVAALAGIVIYQQVNATDAYAAVDDDLNRLTGLPHYPNPIAYLGIIGVLTAVAAAPAWIAARVLVVPGRPPAGGGASFVYRRSRFRDCFLPLMYAAIPLVATDYLARQLPKFLDNAAKVLPAAARPFGAGGATTGAGSAALAGTGTVVWLQVALVTAGTLGSALAAARIARAELAPIVRAPRAVIAGATGLMVLAGGLIGWLYVLIEAAE
jgi:ferredoxin